MVGQGGMQRKFCAVVDEVFANGDLVKLFKDCFTLSKFALNRKFVRFAEKKQVDIVPVAVRANVDLLAYQKASWGGLKLKVCDIELPTHLDPTLHLYSNQHLCDLLLEGPSRGAKFQADVNRLREINIMAQMLENHAADLRRLKIRMSLDVELSDDAARAPLYKHINRFLRALSKCTDLETLTIVQSDHAEKNATVNSVQLALFKIIKRMQLKVLDFNGNMTVDASTADGAAAPASAVLTLIEYIPPSLSKLIVRDGPEPRMFKWEDDDGISADFKMIMSNHDARYALLKSIYLPSSFWSLSTQKFSGFMVALNANHITHIGFSDAFQLNKEPTARTGARLRKPKYMLHFLITNLIQDMVIDLRGGDDAERAVRILWVIQITNSSVIQPIHRSDGGGYTTITMHKLDNCTVQVLI